MRFALVRPARLLGIATLLAVMAASVAIAQEPPAASPGSPPPVRPGRQKTVAFEMRDMPWGKVLEWLADNTGLSVTSPLVPQGTFNHIRGSGQQRDYTIAEVIDILNDALLAQKFLIIRRPSSIIVVPSDDPEAIDVTLLPRLTPDDLDVDKPQSDQRYGRTELAQVIFPLRTLSFEDAERDLKPQFGKFGRIARMAKGDRILVTETMANLRRIKTLLDELDGVGGGAEFDVIQLSPLTDSQTVLRLVKQTYGWVEGAAKPANAPYLELDPLNNRLIIRGTVAQIDEVRQTVRKLTGMSGGGSGAGSGVGTGAPAERLRVINLEGAKATPSTIMENLTYLWSDLRANPIVILTQTQLMQKLEQMQKAPPAAPVKPSDQPAGETKITSFRLTAAQDEPANQPQLVDPRTQRGSQQLPGRADQPIFIAPLSRGTGLMIASDDAESLALIEELVRYLTQSSEGEYAVIAIRHAQAKDVAATLDELYNGKQQANPMQMMMRMGGFGGGGRGGMDMGGGAGGTSANVRVVADTRTNSILVKAPKLELATIRRLVANDLDQPGSDANALNRRYLIGPLQNANATEVVNIIKEIYSQFMAQPSRQGGRQQMALPFPFGGRGGQQQEDSSSSSFTITVAADERTNMVILNAPEDIFLQIDTLVKELDKTTGENVRSVVVRRIDSADPSTVEKALTAITGSPSAGGPTQAERGGQRGGGGAFNPMQQFLDRMRGGQGGFNRGGQQGGVNRGGQGGFNRGGQGGQPQRGGQRGGGGARPEIGDVSSSSPPGEAVITAAGVMDDPSVAATTILYDPQLDPNKSELIQVSPVRRANLPSDPAIQLASLQQPPQADGAARASRQPVQWTVLPDGQIILIGNEQDIREIEEVLNQVLGVAKISDTEIRIFKMERADATSVANLLTRIYQQLILGAAGTTRAQPGQQLQTASLLIIPLPRTNSILVGGPKNRMPDIEENIKKLDTAAAADGKFRTFQLQQASAERVATLLQQLYANRFNETTGQNQIVITADTKTNTVLVQAAPADLEEIESLINYLEKTVSRAINELRIVPVKNAYASDLATLLQQAISEGVGAGALQVPGAQQRPGQPQAGQSPFALQSQFAQGGQVPAGRGYNLRFVSPTLGNQSFESALLEDVFITVDPRTNSLVLIAPPASLDLLNAIIRELDVPPNATADIKVFQLKNTDAQQAFQVIQQLYFGNIGVGGQFGQQGGLGAPIGGAAGGQFGQQARPTGFQTAEGPALINLRLSLDFRTNSVIAAGSQGDLILIEALLTKIDSSPARQRVETVYRVRNGNAADLATALTNFIRSEIQVLTGLNEIPLYAQYEREVVIVPEQVSNTLLISATPRYFPEVMKLIDQIDAEPPQVVIQVLIAEVQLDNVEEFGVEWGLQTPLLFQRSLIPGLSSWAAPATPTGVTVANSTAGVGNPGFNFNSTSPLGNNTNVSPSAVGAQGLSNLGVGRASAGAGVGGFVFSAGSDAINVLIRALKTQGKVEVLSRPQVSVMDNNTALIQAGQLVPIVNGFSVNQLNQLIPIVQQQQIGIILSVQPRVTRDGYVVIRVEPQVSSLSDSNVDLGNGVVSPIINITQASTTISATDGQTVVLGGLIQRSDNRRERKLPWLGDLPYVGAAFRFRTMQKTKRELLILMTPRVVRTQADMERIKAEEARKMDWALDEVENIHGNLQLDDSLLGPCFNGPAPGGLSVPPLPEQVPYHTGEALPMPRNLPGSPDAPPTIQPPANIPGTPPQRPSGDLPPATSGIVPTSYSRPPVPRTGYQPPEGYPATNPQPPVPPKQEPSALPGGHWPPMIDPNRQPSAVPQGGIR